MKKSLLFLFFLLPSFVFSSTVCLNMIVKDEKDVICRCLASVKPYIDYWVIVDTGSSDGTQELIKEFMKDIPGELHEQPWKNFGHNRNEAMKLARSKADYFLFIDADETIDVDPSFNPHILNQDLYYVHNYQKIGKFSRVLMAKTSLPSRWQGVLHEAFVCPYSKGNTFLTSIKMNSRANDGCRSKDPQKYLKDALVLEQGLLDEPNNERYVFYLAQCYSLAKEYDKALENYARRTTMKGGDYGEVIYSQYQVGRHQQHLKYDAVSFIKEYSKCHTIAPQRMEPLYEMARFYFEEKNQFIAFLVARYGFKSLEKLSDDEMKKEIHIHNWVYDWGLPLLYADLAFQFNQLEEASVAYTKVLSEKKSPR